MIETRSEAAAWYESHVVLLTGPELGNLSVRGNAALDGPSHIAWVGWCCLGDLGLEEHRRDLLSLGSLLPE